MGILRNREELLPVTCAILSETDRKAFFEAIKKRAGGRTERIAEVADANASILNDWIGGAKNIPYHALQKLAAEFGVDMPQVSELRREFQAVVDPQKRNQRPTGYGPGPETPRERRPETPRKDERPRPEARRGDKPRGNERRPERGDNRPARMPAGASSDKLTDERAYWSGALLALARREGARITAAIAIDYAEVWAGLTERCFGTRPELAPSADSVTRQAVLPAAAIEGFLSRVDFKDGAAPETAGGAPRWIWSNPVWKTAFLKGVMDAAAEADAEPALKLLGMSDRMQDSVRKLLYAAAVEFKPVEGGLVITGEAAVRRYAEQVGSERPQIKEILAPYAPAHPVSAPQAAQPQAKKEGRPEGRRGRRRGRGRGPERPQPQAQAPAPAPAPQPASAPEPYVEPSDFLPPRQDH